MVKSNKFISNVCIAFFRTTMRAGGGLLVMSAMATPPETFNNPILPGFYPDPSICRVDDTYYVVNSSFEWFPGLPIHRSKDLVNWEPIGYAIERIGQLKHLNLWAPAIRFRDGLFYVVCTERPGRVFYVTAKDAAGPWSDPIYVPIDLKKVSAIDPSLFWDDDGTCWFAANDRKKSGTIKHWVWIQKIDLTPDKNGNASFIGERKYITDGSGVGADNFAEGSHIVKRDGFYYLLIAEGGTWDKHAVSVLRTKDLNAPVEAWEYCPNNPILTHRDKKSPISATGHADFVETQNGEWWSVHLGVRKRDDKHKLGRETFLVPLAWKDGWPVYNPERGNQTYLQDKRPDLPWTPVAKEPSRDDFTEKKLGLQWNFFQEPNSLNWFSLTELPGFLRLDLEHKPFAFVGRRQRHHHFTVSTQMTFAPKKAGERAGLAAMIFDTHQLRLDIRKVGARYVAETIQVKEGVELLSGEVDLPGEGSEFLLKLEANDWDFRFYAGRDEASMIPVGGVMDARILSSEVAKGFTGSYVGMFAINTDEAGTNHADFDWFEYVEREAL